jgi:hypothetical protein
MLKSRTNQTTKGKGFAMKLEEAVLPAKSRGRKPSQEFVELASMLEKLPVGKTVRVDTEGKLQPRSLYHRLVKYAKDNPHIRPHFVGGECYVERVKS